MDPVSNTVPGFAKVSTYHTKRGHLAHPVFPLALAALVNLKPTDPHNRRRSAFSFPLKHIAAFSQTKVSIYHRLGALSETIIGRWALHMLGWDCPCSRTRAVRRGNNVDNRNRYGDRE